MVLVVEQGNPEREELLPSKGDETTVQRIWHSSELCRQNFNGWKRKERREAECSRWRKYHEQTLRVA